MRADRLVALLLTLQTRGPRTATELAGELEVSVRTIYRDVEALNAAGVPVYAERGHGGGIRLVDGYQTRLTGLTSAEAGAIGLLGVPTAAQQLGLGAVLAAVQAKLDASLPAGLRERAQLVRERFLLDAPGWFEKLESVPCLPAVSEAVWADRRIEVRYRRRPDHPAVRRRLGPLGLVLKSGTWYLLALAGRPAELRSYRIDRIESVTDLGRPVTRPRGFDLARSWAQARAAFGRELLRDQVVIRLPGEAMRRLRSTVTPEAAEAAQASAVPDERDGWLRLVLPVESLEVAHHQLLPLAGRVEVIDPPALRRALADTARRLLAAHTDAGQPPRHAPGPPPGHDRGR